MSHTTETTNFTPPPTLAELLAAIDKFPPLETDWMLVSPDGRIWKGDVTKLFAVLAQHHPMLKLSAAVPGAAA